MRRDAATLYVRLQGRVRCAELLPNEEVVVGRGHGADISIPHPSISRRHCSIQLLPEGFLVLRDLGSTNGCWLGSELITEARIRPGTVFRLGEVELVFLRPASANPPLTLPTPSTVVRIALRPQPPSQGTPTLQDLPQSEDVAVLEQLRAAIVGGKGLESVRRFVVRAARVDCPVLVEGETGTGKELVVHWIHRLSRRAQQPLVELNCSALPGSLLEAELFGYERGAFTGAARRHRGVFEQAHGGSLFLDEIGDMELAAQAKLLRTLESGKIQRLGSETPQPVDVRILAATNRNLAQAVAAGTFRADLFFRLNVLHIVLPPLRERKDDVVVLAEHFIRLLGARYGRVGLRLSEPALEKLLEHSWPGNIRELRHCLERAVVFSDGELIQPDDIMISALAKAPLPTPPQTPWTWEEAERWYLERVLEDVSGNKSEAARRLKIHRTTLYKMLKRHGLM